MPSPVDFQQLRLPGEDTWELWRRTNEGAWTKADRDDGTPGGLLGIEALALDSSPFWSLMIEGDDLAGAASLRWESLGVETSGPGQNWTYWRVLEDQGKVLAGTVALDENANQTSWLKFRPDTFEISSRLLPIPSGELALWKELGRYVVAFQRGNQLLHVAVLSCRHLTSDATRELHDLALGLEIQGLLSKVKGIRIWTTAESTFVTALEEVFQTSVFLEQKPAPFIPSEKGNIIPSEIARLRQLRLQRERQLRWLAVGTFALFTFFATWCGWLLWRDRQINLATAELREQQPAVDAVRHAQMRWNALEATVDRDAYPVEVFHQVVSLLPNEGIRLKEFTVDLEKVVISGEASTTNHASKFQADLKANEPLRKYTFNAPQPTILEDNRASFRVEGILTEGGSHAEE